MVACTELGGKTRELAWLPEAIGTVHAHRNNKFEVPGESQTALFDVSTQNNIKVETVVDLRRMLTRRRLQEQDPAVAVCGAHHSGQSWPDR